MLSVIAAPTLYQIETQVRAALDAPTPLRNIHAAFAPRPRAGWQAGVIPADARTSAALVLFYPVAQQVHLVLTRRAGTLGQHAGQISLPGGAVDRDESVEAAAVREAEEEIGLRTDALRVIGRMSPLYIPVSNFSLHPVAAILDRRPVLAPAADEVARILEVPVRELCDPASFRQGWLHRRERTISVPYFELQGERVWGATAMVLGEVRHVLLGNRRAPTRDAPTRTHDDTTGAPTRTHDDGTGAHKGRLYREP